LGPDQLQDVTVPFADEERLTELPTQIGFAPELAVTFKGAELIATLVDAELLPQEFVAITLYVPA
jgi:hypothetical protein